MSSSSSVKGSSPVSLNSLMDASSSSAVLKRFVCTKSLGLDNRFKDTTCFFLVHSPNEASKCLIAEKRKRIPVMLTAGVFDNFLKIFRDPLFLKEYIHLP